MNKNKLLFMSSVFGVLLLLLFAGCKKKEEGKVTVATKPVVEITANSAKCGGNVTATGTATAGMCGVCWSESPSPTTNDFFTTDIVGLGEYISIMNNLKSSTKYYVRAYATLSSGVIMYGEEKEFTTLSGGGNGGGNGTITVTTTDATGITASSATCGGNVTVNGEVTVTARGVCYGTSHSPTLENTHTTDGQGVGSFTSNLTGLVENTIYYVRAYATTDLGTTTYGDEKSFTTENGGGGGTQGELPIVITHEVTEITGNSARCSGEVTSDGGDAVTARGICWSTSPDPTLGNSTAFGGMGTGPFTVQMTDLEIGTTYFVKAYATNNVGTAYGNEISFTTKGVPPQGAINGLFSVSENQQVYFSQGNLQYQASTNTWRFAEHQWDWVGGYYTYSGSDLYLAEGTVSGSINDNISPTYSGWIDLFGWGTSGRNHGAVCYQPWSTNTNDSDYYAYGSPNTNLSDYTGEADWGYNAISNGGNQINLWRTLSSSEWEYVLYHRAVSSGIRFANAKVNDQKGIIVLPDNWNSSNYTLNNANNSGGDFSSNIISESIWMNSFQANGAIFLPNNLCRIGNSISVSPYDVPDMAYYWSSSDYDGTNANALWNATLWRNDKSWGLSVRLVHDY